MEVGNVTEIYPKRLSISSSEGLWIGRAASDISRMVIYIPGLPGDTVDEFTKFASEFAQKERETSIYGIIHSGTIIHPEISWMNNLADYGFRRNEIINGTTLSISGCSISDSGVLPEDWIRETKSAILHMSKMACRVSLAGHSFGGLFLLHALAELVKEEIINPSLHKISVILVSVPTYDMRSLPDRKALHGTDSKQNFTYYHCPSHHEAVDQDDSRIPMSSLYSLIHLWQYLDSTGVI
ncbi:MAG: hypothetical protein PHS44_07995, partial [Candidatus Dojkabacteria bacterium]|nr:hypothetical protein [Candidatus Dojkabacteria bacterium]